MASKTDAADLRLVGVVSDALDDDNGGVREKALQVIQANWQTLSTASGEHYQETAKQMLRSLASKRLRQRPGRQEPRALKRRPRNRAERRREQRDQARRARLDRSPSLGKRQPSIEHPDDADVPGQRSTGRGAAVQDLLNAPRP